MFARIALAVTLTASTIVTSTVANAQSTPSAKRIYKQLTSPVEPNTGPKVGLRELKRNRKLRARLPSINIQSINFEFGSARISRAESWKVQNIADALLRFRRGRNERFLIEGHTDAVGTRYNNQILSEARARSLKSALVSWFGVPRRMLVTAGYGEDLLVVRTQAPEWRNRRVTLRRATQYLH